jgi:hypothetical protein
MTGVREYAIHDIDTVFVPSNGIRQYPTLSALTNAIAKHTFGNNPKLSGVFLGHYDSEIDPCDLTQEELAALEKAGAVLMHWKRSL